MISLGKAILFLVCLSFSVIPAWSSFSLDIKCFPSNAVLLIDNKPVKSGYLSSGVRHYEIKQQWEYAFLHAPQYRDKFISYHQPTGEIEEYKLERKNTYLIFDSFIQTGSQPKSVCFSPSGMYLVTALLTGSGIEVFHADGYGKVRGVTLPKRYAEKKGFVELLFIKRLHELWVSQMTTGMIHVFDSRNFSYKMSFSSRGRWPKVIITDGKEQRAFISNWESHTVSVIDIEKHSVIKNVKVPGIPRGLGVSPDSRYLYAALYSAGTVVKIDLSSLKVIKIITIGKGGAPRHIVVARKADRFYVSDMYRGTVSVVSIHTDRVLKTFYAGSNLNTIVLSPDERYLFISSRGKNSAEGYLHKGPVFGKIFVYDTRKHRLVDWTWGGNQPTGLAVAPNGKMIAFTDFLDGRIEIYRWKM